MNNLKIIISIILALFIVGCDQTGDTARTSATQKSAEDTSLERVTDAGVIYWGADVIGGIPYVYEDPDNPGSYIGFEMDIMKALANRIGVKQKLVIKAWDTLVPELQKGSFDLAMNGLEDTEDRRGMVLFSDPYYIYSQQITVRKDTDGVNSVNDLKGKKVATLSGTAAEDLLREIPEIEVSINPEIIYSYQDLVDGKVEAVVLDTPIAAAYGASNPKLKNTGETFGEGSYVMGFRKKDNALRNAVNDALIEIKNNGELGAIYKKWGLMDANQSKAGVK